MLNVVGRSPSEPLIPGAPESGSPRVPEPQSPGAQERWSQSPPTLRTRYLRRILVAC